MHNNENVGCISYDKDNPIKITVAFNKNNHDEIFFITFYDNSKLENLNSTVLAYKIDLLLVYKEQYSYIERWLDIKIKCIKHSGFKEHLEKFNYSTSCAIFGLMNYLKKVNGLFVQLFLSNCCYLTGIEIQELFNLANLTSTNYGKRKLKLDMLQPLIFEADIERRRKIILYFRQNNALSTVVEKHLKVIPDIEDIFNSIDRSKDDIHSLKKNIISTCNIYNFLKSYVCLSKKCNLFKFECKDALEHFTKIFDIDNFDKDKIELIFNKNVDDYLDLAIKIYKEQLELTSDYLQKMVTSFDCKIHKTSNNTFQLKFRIASSLRKEEQNNISNTPNIFFSSKTSISDCILKKVNFTKEILTGNSSNQSAKIPMTDFTLPKDFIFKNFKSGFIIVTTLELQKLNFKLSESYNQILEIGGKMCDEFLIEFSEYRQRMHKIFDEIAEIDLCLSGYKFSKKYDCCLPVISDEICIVSSYNPLLNKENIIYNDIYMSNFYRISLLTGSNMSGKSVYAKQVLQSVILNQIGYPINAKKATIKLFKRLIYKSNDKISIQKIIDLIDSPNNDENSLLILDELNENINWNTILAFNMAIIKYLLISKAYCLFITHDTEFIKFIEDLPGLNFLSSYRFIVSYGNNHDCKSIFALISKFLAISMEHNEEDNYSTNANIVVKLAQEIQRSSTKFEEKNIIDQILRFNLFKNI